MSVGQVLGRVVGLGEDQAAGAAPGVGERLAHLGEEGEDQAEQQQVTHDPGDVRQAAAEEEEREDAAGQRAERDAPLGEPCNRGIHTGGGVVGSPGSGARAAASRSAMRWATASRLSASMQSITSPAAECTRRCAATKSSALDRTTVSRLTISRRTRAMEASRSAICTIASTYSSGASVVTGIGSSTNLQPAPRGSAPWKEAQATETELVTAQAL